MKKRKDLTDWVVHFVHERKIENEPFFLFNIDSEGYHLFPDNFTYTGEPIYQTEQYQEEDYGLEEDASAFCVLKKILHDGIIKTSWSFRGNKPTIYGPKSAACFTEMPLYALIEYSKSRNLDGLVNTYGIAFIKEEIFDAGARPVIYGLSGKHKEAKKKDAFFGIGLRNLSAECGIGLREMYRYVYTNISRQRRIDWTHEREWRWADLDKKFWDAGLPFFSKNDIISFSKIIILVNTIDEVLDIIELLQNLHHSGGTNYGSPYDLNLIENSYVLALEELQNLNTDEENVKFDDLPLRQFPKIKKIEVKQETYDLVKKVILEAEKINFDITEKKYQELGDIGPCGFANIVTYETNSEITQALIDLEIAHSFAKGEYIIYLDGYPIQSLPIKEFGAIEAAKFVTEKLGQEFHLHSRLD